MDLFWLNKDLVDLSDTEWESLCDHCGKCCLVKLEDQGDVAFTRFACKKYDLINGGCGTYSHRHHIVMSCLNIREILRSKNWNWLPDTCSYRLVFENKPLPYWHPLVSGLDQKSWDSSSGYDIRRFAVHESEDLTDEQLINGIIFTDQY